MALVLDPIFISYWALVAQITTMIFHNTSCDTSSRQSFFVREAVFDYTTYLGLFSGTLDMIYTTVDMAYQITAYLHTNAYMGILYLIFYTWGYPYSNNYFFTSILKQIRPTDPELEYTSKLG